MTYTPAGPFVNNQSPAINAAFLNALETALVDSFGLANMTEDATHKLFTDVHLALVNSFTYTIKISAGGVWPNRSTVPAGYTGSVLWDSADYANASNPPNPIDTDRWLRKIPT